LKSSRAIQIPRQLVPGGLRTRLPLDPLTGLDRGLVVACLITWLFAALLVLAQGLEIGIPGGDERISALDSIPHALIVVGFVGLGVTAAAVTTLAIHPETQYGGLIRFGVGVVAAAVAATLVDSARFADAYREVLIDQRLLPDWLPRAMSISGWCGIAAALAVVAIPRKVAERHRALMAIGAAVPFALAAVLYVCLASWTEYPEILQELTLPPAAPVASAITAVIASLGFWLAVLFLWQAIAGAQAARDVGALSTRMADAIPYLLATLLIAKIGWLVVGYLDGLPRVLGGESESWEASRDDGIVSWLMAACLAGAAGFWLIRDAGGGRLHGEGVRKAAAWIVAGFTGALLLAATALLGVAISMIDADSESGIRQALFDAGDWFGSRQLATQVVTVYLAGLAGTYLVVRKPAYRLAGVFLLIFFFWAFPRALDITITWGGSPDGSPGRAELATLDATVTLCVLALYIGRSRFKWPVSDATLMTVLVGSTAIAYAGVLLSSAWSDGAFYVGLIFPGLYLILFGVRAIQPSDPRLASKLLARSAAAAGLLVIAAVQIGVGFAGPDQPTDAAIGRLLLAPPLAAVLIALALSSRHAEA
jgi:hypothetical protein